MAAQVETYQLQAETKQWDNVERARLSRSLAHSPNKG